MARIDPRALVLVPMLMIAGACGDDPRPAPSPAAPPSAVVAPSAVPSGPAGEEPDPSDSVYVEEEPEAPDPTPEPGDLSDEAQSYLDEALGIELGALEAAPEATADRRREVLSRLPDNPSQVLAALKTYEWLSPEARALYDRAVAAG
jgi:hypothetical protein